MPSLLDMTDVPMISILEQCGFKAVLTLRKVCHGLRNFIDGANFKTELTNLQITINRTDFSFESYSKMVLAGNAKHCTLNDLQAILGIQNSALSTFAVENQSDNPGALDALEEILSNKPRPLQTEILQIEVLNGSQVMQILPHLDSNILKTIRISCLNHSSRQNLEEIGAIMELDHFKNASKFAVLRFSVNEDLKKFFHFKQITVRFEEISLKDLVALKEAFSTSTHMRDFWLHGYKMDETQFEREFGPPATDNGIDKKWYFKIRCSKIDVLEIYFNFSCGISFMRKKVAYVEGNVVVRD